MAADFETAKRISRLRAEALELSKRYKNVRLDQQEGMWLHIDGFQIPPGWNKGSIEILIDVPHGTPGYPSVAPQWFWTDHDLQTGDGKSINHFFVTGTTHADQQHLDKGWGHFCIHLNNWQPASGLRLRSGHSLITYLDLIRAVFKDRGTLSR